MIFIQMNNKVTLLANSYKNSVINTKNESNSKNSSNFGSKEQKKIGHYQLVSLNKEECIENNHS